MYLVRMRFEVEDVPDDEEDESVAGVEGMAEDQVVDAVGKSLAHANPMVTLNHYARDE